MNHQYFLGTGGCPYIAYCWWVPVNPNTKHLDLLQLRQISLNFRMQKNTQWSACDFHRTWIFHGFGGSGLTRTTCIWDQWLRRDFQELLSWSFNWEEETGTRPDVHHLSPTWGYPDCPPGHNQYIPMVHSTHAMDDLRVRSKWRQSEEGIYMHDLLTMPQLWSRTFTCFSCAPWKFWTNSHQRRSLRALQNRTVVQPHSNQSYLCAFSSNLLEIAQVFLHCENRNRKKFFVFVRIVRERGWKRHLCPLQIWKGKGEKAWI